MKVLLALVLLSSCVSAEIQLLISGRGITDHQAELKEAVVEAKIHGQLLIRDLKLVFHNSGSRVAEGDLICPLEEGEEVVSFAMDVNGVRRDAVAVPKKRARHAYETIVARGVDPGLLEVDEVAREFRTRVYPIPANGGKTVWIRRVRWISEGEVPVWPKGLGSPERWELAIETRGGEAGDYEVRQQGVGDAKILDEVSWKPNPGVAYRSTHGDLRVASKRDHFERIPLVEVWLDGTADPSEEALERLTGLLEKLGTTKVVLRVFRETLGKPQSFARKKKGWGELIRRISGEERFGLARPAKLPWKSIKADALVVLTDGEFVFGRGGFGAVPCPLHVIDSGDGKSRWLRSRALASGGGWHGGEGLDPALGLEMERSILAGEVVGRIFYFEESKQAFETPIADWLWARLRLSDLKAQGVKDKKLDEFRLEHGVIDSDSSLIVLETVSQYLEFGITPPESDIKLYQAWENRSGFRVRSRESHLARLAAAWNARCDYLSKPLSPLGERLVKQAQERSESVSKLPGLEAETVRDLVIPLQNQLGEIRSLADDGIEAAEVDKLKSHLKGAHELEKKLCEKVPTIQVTVGGQVRRPGPHMLKSGATLFDAIQAAGGETPYGAMNRVKLYRQGKVYSFDLRKRAHRGTPLDGRDVVEVPQMNLISRDLPLQERDVVEVPQTNILGNGGSGPAGTAPFSDQSEMKIAFERGEAQSAKYYLEDLGNYLDQQTKWWGRYRMFRAACGWRADFYLNVSEFLRELGETEKASQVIADLAETMPDNAEILSRVAMAYRRIGKNELSRDLFARVVEIEPGSAVALMNLARVEGILGHSQEALELYWEAIQIEDSRYTEGRALVALEEMNALIGREGLNVEKAGIDPRLVRHVPVDLRVVLRWDADQSNLDLFVIKPLGGVAWQGMASGSDDPEWWSGNLSKGYGPESWSACGLLPGAYEIGARFYGDWNSDGKSTATAEVEVIRHFGQPDESRESYALRISEKTGPVIVKAKVFPEGWGADSEAE